MGQLQSTGQQFWLCLLQDDKQWGEQELLGYDDRVLWLLGYGGRLRGSLERDDRQWGHDGMEQHGGDGGHGGDDEHGDRGDRGGGGHGIPLSTRKDQF